MKVAISGTHSTGKSTLLEHLQNISQLQEFIFVEGVTRQAAKQGLPINELGSDLTQLYCIGKDLENLLRYQSQSFISDRCVWDTKVYTDYLYLHRQISVQTKEYIDILFRQMIGNFDMIFLLKPEFGLVDDGVRSRDIKFQSDINDLFIETASLVGIGKICEISGTVQQKSNQIIETICQR